MWFCLTGRWSFPFLGECAFSISVQVTIWFHLFLLYSSIPRSLAFPPPFPLEGSFFLFLFFSPFFFGGVMYPPPLNWSCVSSWTTAGKTQVFILSLVSDCTSMPQEDLKQTGRKHTKISGQESLRSPTDLSLFCRFFFSPSGMVIYRI